MILLTLNTLLQLLILAIVIQFTLETIFQLDPKERVLKPPAKAVLALLASFTIVITIGAIKPGVFEQDSGTAYTISIIIAALVVARMTKLVQQLLKKLEK